MGFLTISVRYADPNLRSTKAPRILHNGHGQQWYIDNYPYSDQKPFQFVFEGQLGNGPKSDIAIDDITFSEGCVPSSVQPYVPTTTSPPTSPTVPTIAQPSSQSPINPTSNTGTIGSTSSQSMSTGNNSNKPQGSTGKQSVPTKTSGANVTPTKSSLHKSNDQPKSNSKCRFSCSF